MYHNVIVHKRFENLYVNKHNKQNEIHDETPTPTTSAKYLSLFRSVIIPSSSKNTHTQQFWNLQYMIVRGYIQKFPGWVDNVTNNNKHSLRSNTKGYGGKTH
jgi:hypothetical protein